ncbi:ParB/RepB/Spo0J family partition protein [Streptomyces griseoruber]|uniref:ParB/RepB/Spo0J family partition protein n=1 Tax=Streptomyces griseoruber TaxID=1943 RepID=UPI0006E2BB78|nr:AsnC family transcriptional regulator [Streptomyces griseoruber]
MSSSQLASVTDIHTSDHIIALRDRVLRDSPVQLVLIGQLVVTRSPRLDGTDREYARSLAEAQAELPPILVHRRTMRVVDGVHRLLAARLRGLERIEARFFEGSETEADLLAVADNIAQGRPLSLDDRAAAAERIFASHPQWSDRAVASVAGLSAKKVAEIRSRADSVLPQFDHRVGLDGRVRPLSSAYGRELASELLQQDPQASLRQIARKVGISPATVADVRDRLRRGDDPVPPKQRGLAPAVRGPRQPARPAGPPRSADQVRTAAELLTIFDSLRRDPSLRLNEVGRHVLRMLDACALVARDRQKIVENVPPHCKGPMSELAHAYAEVWRSFAHELRDDSAPQQRMS